jgi:hypothetical protein
MGDDDDATRRWSLGTLGAVLMMYSQMFRARGARCAGGEGGGGGVRDRDRIGSRLESSGSGRVRLIGSGHDDFRMGRKSKIMTAGGVCVYNVRLPTMRQAP